MKNFFLPDPTFSAECNWRFQRVNPGMHTSYLQYYHQYKMVVDNLVDGVSRGTISINTACMPMLLNMRHCLELGLKYQLEGIHNAMSAGEGAAPTFSGHNLQTLYRQLEGHLQKVMPQITQASARREIQSTLDARAETEDLLRFLDEHAELFTKPVEMPWLRYYEGEDGAADLCRPIRQFYRLQAFFRQTEEVLKDMGLFHQPDTHPVFETMANTEELKSFSPPY